MNAAGPGDDALDVLPIDEPEPRRRRVTPSRPNRRPGRSWIVGLAGVVLALVVANLVFGGDDLDEDESTQPAEQAIEQDDAEDLTASTGELLVDVPAGYDGLQEGQLVRHAPEGLPGSVVTVTVMCRTAPDAATAQLLDDCDSGTAQRGTTSPGGRLQIGFQVYQQLTTGDGESVDCAVEQCELRTFGARFGDIDVRAPLGFEPATELATAPRISVEFEPPLEATSDLVVVGEGFPSDTLIHVRPCRMGIGPDPFACEWILEDTRIQTDDDGTFRHVDVADWQIGLGEDAVTCDRVAEGACVMNVVIPGSPRQPAVVPLDFSTFETNFAPVDLPEELVAEPATALADGTLVTVLADGEPYDGEFGLVQCIAANPSDCTRVDFSERADEGIYEVSRSFVTWRGTRHDCVTDGDCTLSVVVFGQAEDRIDVPISFDPDLPLRPARPAVASPTTDLSSSSVVDVVFDQPVIVPFVAICAQGSASACQVLGSPPDQGGRIAFQVRSEIVTPVGPHDCRRDGPCELAIWNGAGLERFEPIPIEFRPDPTPEPRIEVRPSTGLEHGDTVQVVVSGITDEFSAISICAKGTTDCWFVGSVVVRNGKGVTQIALPRRVILFSPTADDFAVVDCGEIPCELRLDGDRMDVAAPIAFADAPAPPAPEIAIEARFAEQPLPFGQPIEVRGRGFVPLSDDVTIQLGICPAADPLAQSCVGLRVLSGADTGADGTLVTEIVLDRSDFERTDACRTECVLVVLNGYGEPATLPVEVAAP